jgi:hypothetical protein
MPVAEQYRNGVADSSTRRGVQSQSVSGKERTSSILLSKWVNNYEDEAESSLCRVQVYLAASASAGVPRVQSGPIQAKEHDEHQ